MKKKIKTWGGIGLFYLLIVLAVIDLNARMTTINKIINNQNNLENVNVAYNR